MTHLELPITLLCHFCSLLQPRPAFLHPLPPYRSTSEASIQDTSTIQLSFYLDWNCWKDFYTHTWFVREEEDLYHLLPCWPPSPGAWLWERTKVGCLNTLDTIFNLHLSNTNISNSATTSQGQRPDLNQHWAPRKWQWACAPCSQFPGRLSLLQPSYCTRTPSIQLYGKQWQQQQKPKRFNSRHFQVKRTKFMLLKKEGRQWHTELPPSTVSSGLSRGKASALPHSLSQALVARD